MGEQISFAQTSSKGVLSMVLSSSPVVQAVLLILICLSIWSWAITIAKIIQFKKARRESTEFRRLFWETRNFSRIDDICRRLSASPLAYLFACGYREMSQVAKRNEEQQGAAACGGDLITVEQALRQAGLDQSLELEKGITFLATVASAAPFIGLFGTVWGIMNAFHGLSTATSTTIQAVAPGISEALVATAIGLAAAIPAAMAYNYFVVAVKHFKQSMDTFAEEFMTIANKYFVR